MVKYSTAGNPVKPRKIVGSGSSTFILECDEHTIKADVNLSSLSLKDHQRVLDWLEQAHAYIAYLRTGEFAERKKRKEDTFNRYKTHTGEKGNSETWRKQADRMKRRYESADESLQLLGLTALPATLDELNKARRKVMLKHHPDHGGSEELAQKINNAYDQLKAKFN